MSVRIVTVADKASAFAMAMKWAARHEPFRSAPVGPFGRTILEAIRRGHARFAVAADGRVLGFGCWALVTRDAALKLRDADVQLVHDPDGEVVALLIGSSEGGAVARASMRHMAALYPGSPFLIRRSARRRAVIGRFPERRL